MSVHRASIPEGHDPGDDPLSPPEPGHAAFDPVLNAWVLSNYTDVLAAFRLGVRRLSRAVWPSSTRES